MLLSKEKRDADMCLNIAWAHSVAVVDVFVVVHYVVYMLQVPDASYRPHTADITRPWEASVAWRATTPTCAWSLTGSEPRETVVRWHAMIKHLFSTYAATTPPVKFPSSVSMANFLLYSMMVSDTPRHVLRG